MTITLTHPKVQSMIRNVDIERCKAFKDWKNLVEKHAKTIPLNENAYNPADKRNKFKGDMFEIFGEFLIKYFWNIKEVGITDYTPNDPENDYGVDGSGIGMDDMPAAVQFKYRSNPSDELGYRELSTFFSQALAKFKVPFENLLVVTTVKELHYTVGEALGENPKVININTIERLVNDNSHFWQEFLVALKNSYKKPLKRPCPKELWKHQEEACVEILKLFQSEENKGQIIIPTGGGKTAIEHKSIIASIDNGGLIHILIDPRIALVDQMLEQEFWPYAEKDCDYLLVRSRGGKDLVEYEGREPKEVEATTTPRTITYKIKEALKYKKPLIIFSTNHSVAQIGKALNKIGTKADLVIGDEAHNLTAENFGEILDDPANLPSKKWLFFTATRRTGLSNFGKGMNNIERFGKIIYQVSPKRLIEEGRIVPPRMHFIYIGGYSGKNLNEIAASMVENGVLEHKRYSGSYCRVIVFCRSVAEVHALQNILEKRGKLGDFFIGSVTSDRSEICKRSSKLGVPFSKYRSYIFEEYSNNKNSVLLNYSILSEGIDLPGTTGIVPLRKLEEIRTQQSIGRSVRILPEDRIAFDKGVISLGHDEDWAKPYGWVILPCMPDDKDFVDIARQTVYAMRKADFDPSIFVSDIGDKSITRSKIPDESDLFPKMKKSVYYIKEKVIDNVEKQLVHEIEEKELADIISDQTIFDFM